MSTKRPWFVASALIAAALLPASADAAAKNRKPASIDIGSALYGPAAADARCDVTNQIRQLCSGQVSCLVPVDQRLCPAPTVLLGGLIMSLTVTFRCVAGEHPRTRSGEGPLPLELRCN